MLVANEINFLLGHGLLLSGDIFDIQNSNTCFNRHLINFVFLKLSFMSPY